MKRAAAKVSENARKNNYRIPIWKNGQIEYEIPAISTEQARENEELASDSN